jgi:hypothetical protein
MATNFEEQREFAKWVLNVGDGSLPAITEKEGVDLDWIKILSHMRLLVANCNLRGLIQTIYPDHQRHSGNAMYFMQRAFWPTKIMTLMKSTMQFLNHYLKNCTHT